MSIKYGRYSLDAPEPNYEPYRTISLIAAPCLTSMFLRNMTGEDSLIWAKNALLQVAPNITHLGIETPCMLLDCFIDVSRYKALKHIELRSTHLEPPFWESLSSCQLLTKVLISFCKEVGDWNNTMTRGWSVDHVHLPALRKLKLRHGDAEVLWKLIQRSRMPMLEYLWWDARSRPWNQQRDKMAAQLKLHSPKLDIDMLYCLPSRQSIYWTIYSTVDSDDDIW